MAELKIPPAPTVYCPKDGERVPIWSETDRAYYAGMVDADGTICFVTQERLRFQWTEFRLEVYPFIGIYNKNKVFIESIKIDLGFGNIYHSSKGSYWRATNLVDVLRMCEIVKPYLRLKEIQCKLMIEYCQSKLRTKNEWRKPWPKPYTERQLEIVQEVIALNRGGKECLQSKKSLVQKYIAREHKEK